MSFVRNTVGSATIEFALMFPAIMFFLFAYGEVGTLAARSVLLERGLDIAFREVRLGNIPSRGDMTPQEVHNEIKSRACAEAFYLPTCVADLHLELTPTPLGAALPTAPVTCRDRTSEIDPAVDIDTGDRQNNANSEIMLVRACFVVNPIFPFTGIGAGLEKDASGGYRIMFETAFLNEPD